MIANASPLIIFGKINRLDVLHKSFAEIVIAQAVYDEVVINGLKINAPDAALVKNCVENGLIKIKKLDDAWRKKAIFLEKAYTQLDYGEAETISLALQEKEKIVLIDEKIAREIAKLHGLQPKGSLYVLLSAFKSNIIKENEMRGIIKEMTSKNFRISAEISNKFWELFDNLKKKRI